jgi:hypothetical protein
LLGFLGACIVEQPRPTEHFARGTRPR